MIRLKDISQGNGERKRKMRVVSWLPLCTFALSLVLWAPGAKAAACCTSATVFGVGRLLVWEEFATGLRTTYAEGLGSWNQKSKWDGFSDGYQEQENLSEWWAIGRISERLSAFGSIPWLSNWRGTPDSSGFGQGLGDIKLGARYEVFSIGEYVEFPALALMGTVQAPTGVRPEKAEKPFAVDATSRGAWVLGAGVILEKTYLPWFGQLSFGVQYPLPFEREDSGKLQEYGIGVQSSLSGGLELVDDIVVLGLSIVYAWEDEIRMAGLRVSESSAYTLSTSLSLSWQVVPHWALISSLSTGLFYDVFGANRPGQLSGTLGVRYGHF